MCHSGTQAGVSPSPQRWSDTEERYPTFVCAGRCQAGVEGRDHLWAGQGTGHPGQGEIITLNHEVKTHEVSVRRVSQNIIFKYIQTYILIYGIFPIICI